MKKIKLNIKQINKLLEIENELFLFSEENYFLIKIIKNQHEKFIGLSLFYGSDWSDTHHSVYDSLKYQMNKYSITRHKEKLCSYLKDYHFDLTKKHRIMSFDEAVDKISNMRLIIDVIK